jgi:hypothetical protein
MATQIKLRRDTDTNWTANSTVVLGEGEIGVNLTSGQFKIGDGTSTWAQLNYYAGSGLINSIHTVSLDAAGSITYPGNVTQSYQDNTSCLPNVDTVVYTSTGIDQKAIKLFVMAEGLTDSGGLSWDTQACDIIAVKGFNNNIVHVTTYGVTYSGATAIATFDGQWNTLTNRIEITCSPVSVTNDVRVSVHAIEMTTND